MDEDAKFEVTWEVRATATYREQFTLGQLLTEMNAEDAAHVRAALAAGAPVDRALAGQDPICLPDSETDSTEIDFAVHERYITEVTVVVADPAAVDPSNSDSG
jgi:hypothetical protein